MNTLPYPEFEKLRLRQLVGARRKLAEVAGQEWMGGTWTGQAIGFTGFWALEDEPGRMGGIEVNFPELDESEKAELQRMLKLPLRAGMGFNELRATFGEPRSTDRFVDDRASHDFSLGSEWPYRLSCTVHDQDGLIYFSLLRENALARTS